MNLNRKQLQERTAIPPATLTWLLKRLNIEPVEITKLSLADLFIGMTILSC